MHDKILLMIVMLMREMIVLLEFAVMTTFNVVFILSTTFRDGPWQNVTLAART